MRVVGGLSGLHRELHPRPVASERGGLLHMLVHHALLMHFPGTHAAMLSQNLELDRTSCHLTAGPAAKCSSLS